MQPARATPLGARRRRAVAAAGRPLRWLRRRPSVSAVAVLLALHVGPVAGGHAEPAPAGAGRVAAADLPGRSAPRTPRRARRPSPPTLAASAPARRAPGPVLGRDTSGHLLVRALGEIRRRDPARYRAMRREVPGWGLTLCDQQLCDRNVQGQTLLTTDDECLTSIEVTATLRAARRNGIPGLPWLADVLVHEHAHCHDLRDEYSSLAAQRAFIDAWPTSPGRDRARRYVQRLYGLLDATGNWADR